MKIARRVGTVAGLLALVIGGTAGAAFAQEGSSSSSPSADSVTCEPADQAYISGELNSDGSQATFTVLNANPLCEPVQVGHAVYLKSADGLVFPQTLFDSATAMISSGTITLSVTLPTEGVAPDCFTQVDAFVGPVIENLTADNRYNERLRDYLWGTVPTCAEVLAESTTTSTSTSTTATTTSTSQPSSDNETPSTDQVLGVQIARSPVQNTATLPQTGPRQDTAALVTSSGLLLMLGSALLFFANSRTLRPWRAFSSRAATADSDTTQA